MKYCSTCLTTNLRPNAKFIDGQCFACHSQKEDASNHKRNYEILIRSINNNKKNNRKKKSKYDCIVGISGGKDSTRQAIWVRDNLKLNPLLVCIAYPPKQMSGIGAKNIENIIKNGFDVRVINPAPRTSANLSRISFYKYGNVCKSTEMALFAGVPRMALDLGINVIFWGENPATQVGDTAVMGENEIDGNKLRKLNTLTQGGNDWMEVSDIHKLENYIYPNEREFDKGKVNIYYLGPVWNDWESWGNAIYAMANGLWFSDKSKEYTGDITEASMLDEYFTNINMMIKYYKFGFGRATDLVCEKIRQGGLTRDEGIDIVEKYDGICSDEIINMYCRYINISVEEFWIVVNKFANKEIFNLSKTGRPIPKFKVGVDYV